MTRCETYWAQPDLTCGLAPHHTGRHVAAINARGYRALIRWSPAPTPHDPNAVRFGTWIRWFNRPLIPRRIA